MAYQQLEENELDDEGKNDIFLISKIFIDEAESRKNPIQDFHSVKQNSRLSSHGAIELSIGMGS